jgi:predicted lipoprotein with Yx(FWY)xxD motif
MSSPRSSARRRAGLLSVAGLVAALTAFAVAALGASALTKAGDTIDVAKHGTVTNQHMVTKTEAIAVNAKGRAIYELVPETVHHALCTKANGCLAVWPPVKVPNAKSKPAAAKGIKGKLGIWHRNGFFQVTLAGHPLYTFAGDTKQHDANGEGIVHFGGTWHVIKASSAAASPSSGTTNAPSTTSTPTYPPGY